MNIQTSRHNVEDEQNYKKQLTFNILEIYSRRWNFTGRVDLDIRCYNYFIDNNLR